MAHMEVWISIGSTYSYLTVRRIDQLAQGRGVTLDWRPFSVREIMVEMDNIPFATKPVKAAYMWRDIARQARKYGLSPHLPAPYPLKEFDLANKLAVVARQQGWCADYIRATYRHWFEGGLPPGEEANLTATFADLGRDRAAALAAAQTEGAEAAYRLATQDARDRGIFGAPSFVTQDEMFWGDDRLEDALDHAVQAK